MLHTAEHVTSVDTEALGEAIAELAAEITVASQRLLTLIRTFDAESGWAAQGALSCAHWLSWRIGLDLGAAREKVRVARALGSLPVIDEAFRRAEVSYSKVRALTRIARPETEANLLDFARRSTASQTEKLCRKLRAVDNAEKPADLARDTCDRYVVQRATDDGMVRLTIQLLPEEAATVMKAIEAARDRSSADRARSTPVDALVTIAEGYLAGGDVSAETRVSAPVEVIVHVQADGHAHLDDGTPISRQAARRLGCDAAVVEVTEDERGQVLDVGRRTRTIPVAIRRALRLRDDGCRFPGCTNRRFVDAHHIEHWADGGATKLENLVELCRRHHRYLHEYGYRIEGRGEGELAFLDPRGRPIPTAPDLPEAGGHLDVLTRDWGEPVGPSSMGLWDGTAADYTIAVDTLRPR